MKRVSRDRGLTLIELVVAMAVFALVAVMGLQSLSGSLRMRDGLTARAEDSAALAQAIAVLRNDLSAVVPMLFFPPKEGRPLSALRGNPDGQGFGLSLGGQPAFETLSGVRDAALWQRAEWRFDSQTGQLSRQLWPTIYPVSERQSGPEVVTIGELAGLSLRSYWPGQGWVDGWRRPRGESEEDPLDGDAAGTVREIYSSELPHAVEEVLETRAYGRITLVEYLQ